MKKVLLTLTILLSLFSVCHSYQKSYFEVICWYTEFDGKLLRPVKWRSPVKYYYDTNREDVIEFGEIVFEKLRKLTGLSITRVYEPSDANFFIYCGGKETFYSLFGRKHRYERYYGMFKIIYIELLGEIELATAFIRKSLTGDMMKTALIEEITQAFGMPNDSARYTNSVFFKHKFAFNSFPTDYSEEDIEVIKTLYSDDY